MPVVDPDGIEDFARLVIEQIGGTQATAAAVAESLVGADLVGHSSHGLVRLSAYTDLARAGGVDPAASPHATAAGPFTQLRGGDAFGQVTGRDAVEILIDEASTDGMSVVGIRESGHLGRIGEWAERVASEGLLFASWVNLQGGSQRIAPAGTADRRLGTNPLTQAIPTFDVLPFDLVYDGATSQVAHGKIIERDGSGEQLPPAWTITESGEPVEKAASFESGTGALLPLGGKAAGHKGFGLAVMAELFAGIIGGGKVSTQERQAWVGNGGAFMALDPTCFVTQERLEEQIETVTAHIRSAEPIDGSEVLLPGEPEYRTAERYRAKGLPIPELTAADLRELADELNLTDALPDGLAAGSAQQ